MFLRHLAGHRGGSPSKSGRILGRKGEILRWKGDWDLLLDKLWRALEMRRRFARLHNGRLGLQELISIFVVLSF